MDGRGPTTGAERHAESARRWDAHPRLATVVRVLLFITPLVAAVLIGFAASATIPPERIGMNRWLWLGLLFVFTTLVLIALRRSLRRLTPLVALMELTLIFPDQAPSRSRAMLRRSNSRAMLRRIEDVRSEGAAVGSSGEISYGDYLVQLLNEVNAHDRLTRGHSERVRAYAEMLGEELDLTDDEMNKLRWAALLHDVGKLDVPAEILNKNGRPSDEEWKVLSSHPSAGGRMLAPLADWLGEWVHAADQHHCRYDGEGYPSSLRGEEITLAGRIVAVADAYDVMTSARSYKKPFSHSAARQELTTGAGTQFDPIVVRAFLNVSLGRIEAVAGPFAWLFQLFSSPQVQIPVLASAPTATGSGAIAVAALGFLGAGGALTEPAGPPDNLAMVTGVVAEELVVDAVEDRSIEITLEAAGGGGGLRFEIDQPRHGAVAPEDGLGAGDETRGFEWVTLYSPPADFAGTDEVVYRACDVLGDCGTATVTIEVEPVNDAPQANDDRVEGITGETFTVDVLANDFDVEGDRLTVVEIGEAANGLATVVDNRIVYLADVGFVGTDRINYVITDSGGERAAATVLFDVLATSPRSEPESTDADPTTPATTPSPTTPGPTLPDPTSKPANQPPVAVADSVTIDEDTIAVIDVLDNDRDPEDDTLTIVAVGDASSGTATLTGDRIRYVPDADTNGTDDFIYVIQDGTNPPVAAAVEVEVTPVNDAPILTAPTTASVAESAAVGTVVLEATATDVDGDDLSFALSNGAVTAPLLGEGPISLQTTTDPSGRFTVDEDGRVTVAAALDHETIASLELVVEVTDGTTTRDSTVTVDVVDVNEAPTVADDAGTGFDTAEDVAFTTASVLTNDGDPESSNDQLVVTVETGTSNGALVNNGDGTFGYTPDPEWSGTDGFTYRITDPGSLEAGPATVTIVVADVNDAPAITDPGAQTGAVGTPFSLQLAASDIDSGGLTYTATGLPSGLTITAGGLISGRPGLGTVGVHTVTATVTDNGSPAASASTTFNIDLALHEVSAQAGSIVINELLYDSVSTTAPEEFVELRNVSASAVDLTGWTIDDANRKASASVGTLAYTIPASDHWGRPSTLAAGEYAVIWLVYDGANLPPLLNAADGLEYVVNSASLKLGDAGDDVWVLDPDTRIVDYVAFGPLNGTPPEASLGLWDSSDQASLGGSGARSISLTPNGADGNTASCWEATGSDVAAGRCPGALATVDSGNIAGLATSVGRHNNLLADAGGPYSIDEGDDLALDATASVGAATYDWDLDNDGAYDDATGVDPIVPWTTLQAAGIGDDGTYPIGVEARTADGLGINTATATLTISNVDPVLAVSGPATISAGATYTLTLGATDPGDDTISSWIIDWGDGNVITTVGSPATIPHTYTRQGFTHDILVSATDEDGTYFTNDLLVPSYTSDELFWFSSHDGAFLRKVAANTDPIKAVVGPDGMAYVSGDGSSDVRRYNASSGAFVDTFVAPGSGGISGAEGMAFGPDGHLYLADYDGDAIRRYDGTTGAHLGSFASAGLDSPYDVIFGPNGDLYTSSYDGDEIRRYDGTTGALVSVTTSATIEEPEQIAFGPDGNLYVASFASGQVLRFNGATGLFMDVFIDTGGAGDLDEPTGIAFGPDGNLYVADFTDDVILRYDALTGAFMDEYLSPTAGGLVDPALLTWVPTLQVTVEPPTAP